MKQHGKKLIAFFVCLLFVISFVEDVCCFADDLSSSVTVGICTLDDDLSDGIGHSVPDGIPPVAFVSVGRYVPLPQKCMIIAPTHVSTLAALDVFARHISRAPPFHYLS